ncbi:DUF2158 domain-containing protein [Acinetobacter sp. ANC 3781]|uniref:YodC family protein n=1 Tax=Acinetobacter sp. ANC 3781 TaxID=2529835 RepID=UPI00103D3550|nr:DUF2158 domain-containing protein [Acinetobacter sp. ANC 3781]TCB79334.1 DUF2158 domain-containing protein [Acinetobacter sp. ANC 3781]
MSDIKVGDVVQLKSGGSLMTVSEVNDAGWSECTWFDKDGVVKKHYFLMVTLQKHETPKPNKPRTLTHGVQL